MKLFVARLVKHVADFLRWWASELVSVMRLGTLRFLPNWKGDLIAFMLRSGVSLVESGASLDYALLKFPRPEVSDNARPPAIDAATEHSLRRRRVRVIVDPEFAFVRRMKLPLAAMPHLASAVRLQTTRLLPLQADRMRSDFRVTNVDAEGACIEVELAAIRCGDIEPVEAALRHWTLDPYAVHLGQGREGPFRFNLEPPSSHGRKISLETADAALTAGAGSLAVLLTLMFAFQSYLAQRSLQQALHQSSAEAQQIMEQRQSLNVKLEMLSALSAAERSPTVASILSEVTQRVGHESWVTTFDLEGDNVQLTGWTPDAAALVAALSSSRLLMQVELRSAQTDAGKAKGERFQIRARVKLST